MASLTIGGIPIKTPSDLDRRLTMLLWGSSGCGKTTFAASAPGRILWINFDPDGYNSLVGKDDIILIDLASLGSNIVTKVKDNDPFGIGAYLKEHEDVQTVVIDSVTTFSQLATEYSYQGGKAPGALFENPGMAGYGMRNRFALGLIKQMLRVTKDARRHIIFICHEDVPRTDDKGNVLSKTILLGGSLPEEVPLQISEVWHMRESAGKRMITFRSTALTKPMKTRLFKTGASDPIEFVSKYDPDKPNSAQPDHTIEGMYEKWIKANGKTSVPV